MAYWIYKNLVLKFEESFNLETFRYIVLTTSEEDVARELIDIIVKLVDCQKISRDRIIE